MKTILNDDFFHIRLIDNKGIEFNKWDFPIPIEYGVFCFNGVALCHFNGDFCCCNGQFIDRLEDGCELGTFNNPLTS